MVRALFIGGSFWSSWAQMTVGEHARIVGSEGELLKVGAVKTNGPEHSTAAVREGSGKDDPLGVGAKGRPRRMPDEIALFGAIGAHDPKPRVGCPRNPLSVRAPRRPAVDGAVSSDLLLIDRACVSHPDLVSPIRLAPRTFVHDALSVW